jgi:hypothetical protein
MTLGKHRPATVEINLEDLGIKEYHEADVLDVDQDMDVLDILLKAVNVHSFNTKRRDDFNHHPENQYPEKDSLALVLPEGADPHEPVLQLARAGVRDCGFPMMASIDSTKPLVGNRPTTMAADWIDGMNKKDNKPGIVLFVERSEDAENPRLRELRESMSRLTVPRLTVITTAAPNELPLYEELCLNVAMLEPEPSCHDAGPGMANLG